MLKGDTPGHADDRFFIDPTDDCRFTGFDGDPVDKHLPKVCNYIGSEVFCTCRRSCRDDDEIVFCNRTLQCFPDFAGSSFTIG